MSIITEAYLISELRTQAATFRTATNDPDNPVARLLEEAAQELEDAPTPYAYDELRRERDELRHALDQERQWMPDGVYIIRRIEGGMSRASIKVKDFEDLDAIMPMAAVLKHHHAITRAVSRCQEEIRASVTYDADGRPRMITYPSAASIADRICDELAKELQP